MRVALTSAIYGGYDRPKKLPADLDVTGFLFTDSEETWDLAAEAGWTPILDEMDDVAETPMLRAKWWKTHPLSAAPGFDASIWLDGSMTIVVDDFVGKCLAALKADDVSFTPHPERTCIHTEARVTESLARYADCRPVAQANFYRSVVGHPDDWGLFASGAFTVRHNERTRRWGQLWWDDCVNWTYQDQLSLPVITRLEEAGGLTWNRDMPWHLWWHLAGHGY